MHLLHALELLERRPAEVRSDVLDCDITIHGECAWAEFACAAAMLGGGIDDALTSDDLDESILHFVTCLQAGIVSEEQWRETANEVIAARLSDLEERGLLETDAA